MGNSEVGHMNIGAGRVVWMDLPRIDNAIADGSFAANAALGAFVAALKASGGTAHVCGPRLARRRARAPAAHRRGGAGDRGARACRWRCMPSSTGATCRRRARWGRSPRWRRRCPRGRGSRRSPGGSTPWTATSAGTGWPRRWRRSCAARASGRRAPTAAIEAAYARGETDEFVHADGDRRLSRGGGRRRALLRQLPRRPGAANPRGAGRSGLRRLRGGRAAEVGGGCSAWCSIPRRWTR